MEVEQNRLAAPGSQTEPERQQPAAAWGRIIEATALMAYAAPFVAFAPFFAAPGSWVPWLMSQDKRR